MTTTQEAGQGLIDGILDAMLLRAGIAAEHREAAAAHLRPHFRAIDPEYGTLAIVDRDGRPTHNQEQIVNEAWAENPADFGSEPPTGPAVPLSKHKQLGLEIRARAGDRAALQRLREGWPR